MRLHRTLRTAVAVACAVTLGAAPLLVHTTATAKTAEAAIQSITIKVAKKTITVRGANGLHAGRVEVDVKGVATAEILMFSRGYDTADFNKDVRAFDKSGDIRALRRAIAHTQILGGIEPGGSGTIVLPKAGDYTVFSFSSRGHADFSAGAARKAPTPGVDGKIIARTGPKWSGSSTLPAKGTFKFKNADRTTPHFVILQQVVEGTTTDEVLAFLQDEEQQGPPPFGLPGALETGSLSPGRTMTADYNLPPGQYVIMCFFPDPNMGGMPHALMGMLRMIHLT